MPEETSSQVPATVTPSIEETFPGRVDRKIDIAKALKMRHVNGNTLTEIAAYFGCTRQAVSQALQKFDVLLKDAQLTDTFNANSQRILEGVLMDVTSNMLDSKTMKKASLNNLAYTFDRIFNALRLLKGESTANIEHAHHFEQSIDDIDKEIAEIQGQAVGEIDEEQAIDAQIAELEQDEEAE